MKTVIKKAEEGGYDKYHGTSASGRSVEEIVLDSLFWESLGKACGWNDENTLRVIDGIGHTMNMETGKDIPVWKHHALRFHEINLTEDWGAAVAYLTEITK